MRSPLTLLPLLLLLAPSVRADPRSPGEGMSAPTTAEAQRMYRWPRRESAYVSLAARIPAPPGWARIPAAPGSYAHWLRHLPVRPAGTPVRSFRGREILPAGHRALAAVVDLDLSRRDRQQCIDTIIRLRGEYLFSRGQADRARFLWAGGLRVGFADWRVGRRPVQEGRWRLVQRAPPTAGYGAFRAYLEHLFSWTGTMNHRGERRVEPAAVAVGDFFIQAGSPGHAVVVLDLARDGAGRTRALLGQGFMPAQDLHVLRAGGEAWFSLDAAARSIATPLWWRPFSWADLRRFAD